MTALDDAVEALQAALAEIQAVAAADVVNLWQILAAELSSGGAVDRQAIIAALRDHLPDLVIGYVGVVAETTAGWYDQLAPDEKYTATVPPDTTVTAERIAQSISWAVNTATSAQTALAQLQGSVHRAVLDAQRATVAHNAAAERVRYRRHTNYAGACNWCLTMATRGAVYTSAASAVRGHDNCKCIAVPERQGTKYTVPTMVRDAEVKYAEASRQLAAEGVSPTLDNIIKRMDLLDAGQPIDA